MQGVVRMFEPLALSTRLSELEAELRESRKPEGDGAIRFRETAAASAKPQSQ